MNGLEVSELTPPSFLQRLFHRGPRENAAIKIHNIIATTPIRKIQPDKILEILADHRSRIEDLSEQVKVIYGAVLRNAAEDRQITDDEVADLSHLKRVLGISDSDVAEIEKTILSEVFRGEVQRALADGRVTAEESTRLDDIAARLKLPAGQAVAVLKEDVTALYRKAIEKVIDDGRLTPSEEAELLQLRENLGLKIEHGDDVESVLNRCRLLWRIDQGDLPSIDPGVNLQRGETCHATIAATLSEIRTRTRRLQYAGPTARIRIAKGIYFRAGDVAINPVTQSYKADLGTGQLLITSKRLLFDGSLRNIAIPLSKVLDFTVFSDGLMIEKDTGKDQFFECSGDLELLGAIVDGAIRASKVSPASSRGRGPKGPKIHGLSE